MSHVDPKNGDAPPTDADAEPKPASLDRENGPRATVLKVGDEDVVVLSVPLPVLRYPEGTTATEQEIIALLLDGLTSREIAEVRGVSSRTVTTQLGAIFQKAGVNSQAELIAVMTETEPED